jgi:hypothetical protein
MNMTRKWSDHYKLVMLEKKGTEAQRHKEREKGPERQPAAPMAGKRHKEGEGKRDKGVQ